MQIVEVTTIEQAKELIKVCPDIIAIDTEYVPGDPRTTKLTSIIIADESRAWLISPPLLPMLTPMIRARKALFLQDYDRCDTIILYQHGCDIRDCNTYNLIDMHHLIDENADHSLGARVLQTFNDDYKIRLKGHYDDIEYQGKDGIYTYRLGLQDLTYLTQNNLEALYNHVRNTSNVLLNTTLNGIFVDEELVNKTYVEMGKKINEFLPKLRWEFKDACTGWELKKWQEEINKRSTHRGKLGVPRPEFSFASDQQVRWLLYEYIGIPIESKTKKGNPSTDYETLKSFVERYPAIQTLVDYKETKSVFSTFVVGIKERIENGKIYPHFNVSGTTTGRISHSNPNMGNLPTDGVIRNFFLPSPGYVIIGADYSQLEVVIEASLTRDPQLLRIINEGVSKHDITAEGLGVDRNTGKTLNFALQYGAGVQKVAKLLGISKESAEDVFSKYWNIYSGVKALKEETVKALEEKGKVINLFGRIRHLSKSSKHWEWEKSKRQGYNFLIQGVAGDCCNMAMWKVDKLLKFQGIGRVLFTVHDEIVCEVLDNPQIVELCKTALKRIMESISEVIDLNPRLTAKTYGPLAFWSKT